MFFCWPFRIGLTRFCILLSFLGVGLVFLSVCNIYQPALSSTGVLFSLQEEEDTGKVSTFCEFTQLLSISFATYIWKTCNEPWAYSTSYPVLLLLCVKLSNSHIQTHTNCTGGHRQYIEYLTCRPVQLHSFCLQQSHTSNHDILSCRYGDMRVMMGCEIFSMWQNLGEMKNIFVISTHDSNGLF